MEVVLTYLSASVPVVSTIRFFRTRERSIVTSDLSPVPDLLVDMSNNNSSNGPSALQNNPHLVLFQSMGHSLRHDPTAVIAQISVWFSDPNSPRFWAPFALSIRGFAYEVMEELDLARMDYVKGLRLYESLAMELGTETIKRMESNVNFMRVRIRILPLPKPKSRRDPNFVIIDESDYLRPF